MVAVAVARTVIGIVDAFIGLLLSFLLVLDVGQSRSTLCMVMNAEDYLILNHFFVDDGTHNSFTVHISIHRPERRRSSQARSGRESFPCGSTSCLHPIWRLPVRILNTSQQGRFRMAVHAENVVAEERRFCRL
jgi:hypothetical protein